jgi:hypothetical protein
MPNFYDELDFIFNNALEKYEEKDDDITLSLISLKSKIISIYENTKNDNSYELYITNSIQKKYFNINEDGTINSYS